MAKLRQHWLIVITVCLAALAGCLRDVNALKPPQLIEFITIESEKSTLLNLDEIIFAKKYNPRFSPNPNVQVVYQPEEKQIILTPNANFTGLTLIQFSNANQDLVLPVIVKGKTPVVFSYRPAKPPQALFLMGNFNDWNRSSLPMSDPDQDGVYECTVYLDEGIYEYQFVVDKKEIFDPQNPEKVDNGFGYFNSVKRVESASPEYCNIYFLPQNRPDTLDLVADILGDTTLVQFIVLWNNQIYNRQYLDFHQRTLSIDLTALKNLSGIQVLRIVALYNQRPGNILTLWLKGGKPLPNRTFIWNDAVIYALMLDRFKNGDPHNDRPVQHPQLDQRANFQGGDFAGLRQVINSGYFDSLGVNALWISPVTKTTDSAYQEWPQPRRFFSGYHGYWPTASRQTEPRFGSLDEFKKVVTTAHQHQLKVLLDFVANHTHIEHPYYQKHRDWYGKVELPDGSLNIRRWDEYRLTTWFDTFLPSFDYENSRPALETMTDHAIWWLKKTKIDGFRHDATKHVPYTFWKTLTSKIKNRVDPHRPLDTYQIGECFGSHQLIKSYVNNGLLNSQFNFIQFFIARRTFVEERGDFRELETTLARCLTVYGYNHLMGNIMDSHDQVRMMAFFDGDLRLSDDGTAAAWREPPITVDNPSSYLKEYLYLSYLLTTPGVPIINYGDEFGMTGANDPDNRRMMRFGTELTAAEKQQLKRVQALLQFRQNHPALRRGDYANLYASQHLWAFTRGNTQERFIIVLNKSNSAVTSLIPLPLWLKIRRLIPELEAATPKLEQNYFTTSLPPYGMAIYRCEF
jgi:glycosidase